MPDTSILMLAFMDELEKTALVPGVLRKGLETVGRVLPSKVTRRAVGHGIGTAVPLPAMAGAAVGGGYSGVKGYREAREHGAGAGQAALYGAVRGVGGAALGGLLGAGAGAGAGALAGKLAPKQVTELSKALASRPDLAGKSTRFTQRQIHALTGWTPSGAGSLKAIGGPAGEARAAAGKAQEALMKARTGKFERPWHGKAVDWALVRDPGAVRAAEVRRLERGAKRLGARARSAAEAEAAGVTSLPGIAKAVGRGDVKGLWAGAREQYHGMGPVGKALMYGFPAVGAAHALATPTRPGGPGKAERLGSALGTLGYAAAPLTLPVGIMAGMAGERLGTMAGRGIDTLLSRRRQVPPGRRSAARPPATEPGDTGQVTMNERIMGPGISGQQPEIGGP